MAFGYKISDKIKIRPLFLILINNETILLQITQCKLVWCNCQKTSILFCLSKLLNLVYLQHVKIKYCFGHNDTIILF